MNRIRHMLGGMRPRAKSRAYPLCNPNRPRVLGVLWWTSVPAKVTCERCKHIMVEDGEIEGGEVGMLAFGGKGQEEDR